MKHHTCERLTHTSERKHHEIPRTRAAAQREAAQQEATAASAAEQPPTLREERDFQRHIMSIGREGSDRLRAFLAQLHDVG